MTRSSVEAIVRALNEAKVRYLIAGGLAVVAHGYVRFTADIDIVLSMDTPNVGLAILALQGLGYRPRAPVPFEDFADASKREDWRRVRSMTVFSVHSPEHPATEVDLFVEAPFDFDQAFTRARRAVVAPGVEGLFVGYDDLIAMKRKAARPQDLEDVARLESLGGREP